MRHDEGLEIWFLKIVLLLRATGSVTTGNLSVFDVTGSKARDEYCKRATGDARLLRCRVTNGNEVSRPWQHQFCKSSLCQAWSDERRLFYCSRYWTFQERFFPVFGARPWFLFYMWAYALFAVLEHVLKLINFSRKISVYVSLNKCCLIKNNHLIGPYEFDGNRKKENCCSEEDIFYFFLL